jgi:uridine phosphorylase
MQSDLVITDGRAYHIAVAPDEIAPLIFQVGDPDRAFLVAERFDSIEHEVRHREFVTLTGTLGGKAMTVMGTGIGHDNVEIALLEAYTLLAFDLQTGRLKDAPPAVTLIRIGTSGGAQADIEPGTLGITSYALGLDSTGLYWDVPVADEVASKLEQRAQIAINEAWIPTSRFKGRIAPYASKASPDIVQSLERQAQAVAPEIPAVTGFTVATPGFYGASGRRMEGLQLSVPGIKDVSAELRVAGQRVINFEMESSLIFHLAQGLNWRAGTICPIISNPKTQGTCVDYKPYVNAAIDIAIQAMLEL